ncbi:unnamed protein product [Spirodela intermedia]|uniref:Uncharacterized protein n=1 Tax=Spirodela intermedia TaxID=51605 RepID=A0A7I8J542_SPIIN|nr:unnamed protein product [Spirodela intermedia]CAA6665356.1 unnamed protein product [Spirodela intermedia]
MADIFPSRSSTFAQRDLRPRSSCTPRGACPPGRRPRRGHCGGGSAPISASRSRPPPAAAPPPPPPPRALLQVIRLRGRSRRRPHDVGAAAAVGNGVALPLTTLFFGHLINAFGSSSGAGDVLHQVSEFVYVAVAAGVAAFLLSCWTVAGERQAARIRGQYLKTILRQDMAFFDTQTTTGESSPDLSKFLQLVSTFFTGFVIAFVKGWQLALVMTFSLVPLLAASVSKMSGWAQSANADAGDVVEQTVASFSGEAAAAARYDTSLRRAYGSTVQEGLAAGVGLGAVLLMIYSNYGLATWYGGKLIVSGGGGYDGGTVVNRGGRRRIGCSGRSSGGGKSTVIGQVARFYDPQEGKVLVDGVDIRKLRLRWLRERIGLVSQEPVLFSTTIRENVAYGRPDATAEEISAAVELANAVSFIDKIPEACRTSSFLHSASFFFLLGIDAMVGERRAQLSGGQKQRIAIARAILRSPRILLLDEATSAMDAGVGAPGAGSSEPGHGWADHHRRRHHLHTVRSADVITVLRNGRIVEQDSHAELVRDPEGLYSRLIRLQDTEPPEKADDGGSPASRDPAARGSRSVDAEPPPWEEAARGSRWRSSLFQAPPPPPSTGWCSRLRGAVLQHHQDLLRASAELRRQSRFWVLMYCLLGVVSLVAVPLKQYLFALAGGSSGAIATRLSADAAAVRGLVGDSLALVVQNSATVAAGLVIAMAANWRLALIILALIPLVGLQGYVQMKILAGFSTEAKRRRGGIRTVAAFCAEDKVMEAYDLRCRAPARQSLRQGVASGLGFGFSSLVLYCAYALIFYVGARFVQDGKATFGQVFRRGGPGHQQSQDSVASLFAILDRESKIDPGAAAGRTLTAVRGDVDFQRVSFSYLTRPDVPVLRDLCLSVRAGKVHGCAGGESGSGKSTVVAAAATVANAHGFICGLPVGYSTAAGDEGVQLSGAQRQRIAIARAVLRDPRVLLLDEPSAALNAETERALQAALDMAAARRTTVVVAHRLSTVRGVDAIAVPRNVEVVEMGTHAELLQVPGGAYASLLAIHLSPPPSIPQ